MTPSMPTLPAAATPPDQAAEAVQNAKMMERRRLLGLQGRMSTYLTTAQQDGPPVANAPTAPKTLLGQ